MARLTFLPWCKRICAETDQEIQLVTDAQAFSGSLVLEEALYPLVENSLILPDTATQQGAWRVCGAFEKAAWAHHQARQRRRRFHLVKK